MNYKKLNMLFLLSIVSGAFLLQPNTQAAQAEQEYRCACGKTFKDNASFQEHQQSLVRQRVDGSLPFPCTNQDRRGNCLQRFAFLDQLTHHTRVNHMPAPLTAAEEARLIRCPLCNPNHTFPSLRILNLHQQRHHRGVVGIQAAGQQEQQPRENQNRRVVRQAVEGGQLGQPVPRQQRPGERRQRQRDHRNDLQVVNRGLAQLQLGQPAQQQQQQQMDVEQQQQQPQPEQ